MRSRYVAATTQRNRPITNNVLLSRSCQSQRAIVQPALWSFVRLADGPGDEVGELPAWSRTSRGRQQYCWSAAAALVKQDGGSVQFLFYGALGVCCVSYGESKLWKTLACVEFSSVSCWAYSQDYFRYCTYGTGLVHILFYSCWDSRVTVPLTRMAGCYQRTSTPRGHGHVAHARSLYLSSPVSPICIPLTGTQISSQL